MKQSPLKLVILAVTKTYNSYCIAGMSADGSWYRPLPTHARKFWSDVRYSNGQFIQVGDVWEISSYRKEADSASPGHTEDIRLIDVPIFTQRLTNEQLIRFLENVNENEHALNDTFSAKSRSLCLIKVDDFSNFVYENNYDGQLQRKARITFSYNGKTYRNITSTPGFPITDLKWRAYTLQEVETPTNWNSAYICIGLARTEPKKGLMNEYPMVISVVTDPYMPLLPTYPN